MAVRLQLLAIQMKAFGACVAALFVALTLSGCGGADIVVPTTPAPSNIVETAQADPELSQLVALLSQAGLVEALSGPGPFTVFAPWNMAFTAAVNTTIEGLSDEQLREVLQYHVVAAREMVADLKDNETLTTLFPRHQLTVRTTPNPFGGTLEIIIPERNVTEDPVVVRIPDVVCSNGVIQMVTGVLLPILASDMFIQA